MKALTLHRPWPFMIIHGGKRVENRTWKPWAEVIGQRIALHAGLAFADDVAVAEHIPSPMHLKITPYDTGIVCTALIKGWVRRDAFIDTFSDHLTITEAQRALDSEWFAGPYGWVLDNVRELPEPIPCRGAQGLWDVPDNIAERIEAML